jgi:hypothetical protein
MERASDRLDYPKSKLSDESSPSYKTSKTSRKMPPSSDVTKCKKRQKLTMLPRPRCGSIQPKLQLFIICWIIIVPTLSQPSTVKEINTNTPLALLALSVNWNHWPFDAHSMFNILAQLVGLKIS